VEALGRGQVLEPVLAKIAQPFGAGQCRGRGRNQYLPAVAAGGDACRAVNVQPDVALLAKTRGTGVDAHPYAYRTGGEPCRCLSRSLKRAGAVGKVTKKASPCVSTSTPPAAANDSRRIRRCSASASA
jgi:hypothetical protein